MDSTGLYDEHDSERWVAEPPKRVEAPERTPYERDRARVVHAAASRRLAAKTQVHGPQMDDFVRNRLTHSLEVAQVARDLSRALGSQPDIAETAALAHDLGHPPFGHNGEHALHALAEPCGGFEGNAQTLRLLTRLEAKTVDESGRSVGLNLTRATLDACTKYPWPRTGDQPKFGVYGDDLRGLHLAARGHVRRPTWRSAGAASRRRSWTSPTTSPTRCTTSRTASWPSGSTSPSLDRPAVWETVRDWYLPEATDAELDAALAGLTQVGSWPEAPYDGSRRSLAALKNLTSDLIGRFCGAVQEATFAAAPGPFVRYRADLVVPEPARDRDGGAQGHRRALRDAGRRPGRADDPPAGARLRAGRGAAGARAGLAGPDVRRGLEAGGRRRGAAAGGHRPGRLAHRRQRRDLARPAGPAGERRLRDGVARLIPDRDHRQMHTSRRTALLVVAVVIAFLVGAVAPATGAALTKRSVKKIAAKVVKKSAPSLSVAHATTAGDATSLQGKSAASLQSASFTYKLNPSGADGTPEYAFSGLPAGTYLVTYDVLLSFPAVPSNVACYLKSDVSSAQLAYSHAAINATVGTCSGNAVVTTPQAGLRFRTSASQLRQVLNNPDFPSTVTFTRLDTVTAKVENAQP